MAFDISTSTTCQLEKTSMNCLVDHQMKTSSMTEDMREVSNRLRMIQYFEDRGFDLRAIQSNGTAYFVKRKTP